MEQKQEQSKYGRALQIREPVLGPDHPLTRDTAKNYIAFLRTMKRDSEADELQARFPPKP